MRRAAGSFPFSALLWALRSPRQCLGAGDGGTMSPRTAAVRQTCCCFNVRIATTALAIYHVVSVRAGAGGCACVPVCVRACVRGPTRHSGRTATRHRSEGPWTDPFPALGLSLPLCQTGKGPCSRRRGRAGLGEGALFQANGAQRLLRLSFRLCKMAQKEQPQGSNGTAARRGLWKAGMPAELWARTVARLWSWTCFFLWGAWAAGGEEGGALPCAPSGEGGGWILLVDSLARHCPLSTKEDLRSCANG